MTSIREYSSDVEGGAPVRQRFDVTGRLGSSYLAFVSERAGWLSLGGFARHAGPGRVEIVATGPEALVGALEMACTLGPLDALIDAVEVSDAPGPQESAFVTG
jgi:acylphosphatase